jgi:hypothetical protein
MAVAGSRSGGDLEQMGDEDGPVPHASPTKFSNPRIPDYRHRLVGGKFSSGRMKTAKAEPWSDQALHTAVALFHAIIRKIALPQAGEASQIAVLFHVLDRTRVGRSA